METIGNLVVAGIFGAILLSLLSPLLVFILSNAVAANYGAAAFGFAVQGFIVGMLTILKTK